MWRILTVIAFGLIIFACGGGIGSYEEGMEAHAQIMEEMVSVLEGVTDEASAKKAAGKIEALGTRLSEISMQVAELPRPNAKEMQEFAKKQMAKRQSLQQKGAEQMIKLAEYPVLQEAWMRAMENMR